MAQITPPKRSHTKVILFLLVTVIVGPFLLAYNLVQKGSKDLPLSNHGDLISPLPNIAPFTFHDLKNGKDLAASSLLGKWWLVYVGPEHCMETCYDMLYNMRQIRTALGKESARVDRLFIAHPHCETSVCEKHLQDLYPEMVSASLTPQDFEQLFGTNSNQVERQMVGELYIIDPKGNIMMHYDVDTQPKSILSDIKRLLKASQIG